MQNCVYWHDQNGGWRLAVVDTTGHKWWKVLTLTASKVDITKVKANSGGFRDSNVPVMDFIRKAIGTNINGVPYTLTQQVGESLKRIAANV